MKFTQWLEDNMQEMNFLGVKDTVEELLPILAQFGIDTAAQHQLATAISAAMTKGITSSLAVQQAGKILNSGQMQLVNFIKNNK